MSRVPDPVAVTTIVLAETDGPAQLAAAEGSAGTTSADFSAAAIPAEVSARDFWLELLADHNPDLLRACLAAFLNKTTLKRKLKNCPVNFPETVLGHWLVNDKRRSEICLLGEVLFHFRGDIDKLASRFGFKLLLRLLRYRSVNRAKAIAHLLALSPTIAVSDAQLREWARTGVLS